MSSSSPTPGPSGPSPPTPEPSEPSPPTPGPSSSGGKVKTAKKPTYESLKKHTIAQLKIMCKEANVKSSRSNKDQLIRRLLDPVTNNKDRLANMRLPYWVPSDWGPKTEEMERVNKLFEDAGLEPHKMNKCLKAGILNGFVPLTKDGALDLDHVLLKSGCNCCDKELTCTVRQALYQPEYGGDQYETGGETAAIKCSNEDEECGGNYITGLCRGDFSFDCGKFHNHCNFCSDFGICIADREAHCRKCDKHYYAGGLLRLHCPDCDPNGEGVGPRLFLSGQTPSVYEYGRFDGVV